MFTVGFTGQTRYSSLLDHPHSWEESLRLLCASTSPQVLLRLLRRRPEAGEPCEADPTAGVGVPEADRNAFADVIKLLESVDR